MKNSILIVLILTNLTLFAQSEQLIPQNAVTVFSINNLNLLQKISMDELVKYDFMEEVHQELFDGSTSEKTLKDAGIDFNQRLNVFYGKNDNYELSGFTFGVKIQRHCLKSLMISQKSIVNIMVLSNMDPFLTTSS